MSRATFGIAEPFDRVAHRISGSGMGLAMTPDRMPWTLVFG